MYNDDDENSNTKITNFISKITKIRIRAEIIANVLENCEGITIRTSESNLPQIQIVSARPTPPSKNKDNKLVDNHYLKFKEYCWMIEEYEDPFFVVTIRPFITFKNETCQQLWVLNDMVLRKAKSRAKRLSIGTQSSPSKSLLTKSQDFAKDEEIIKDKDIPKPISLTIGSHDMDATKGNDEDPEEYKDEFKRQSIDLQSKDITQSNITSSTHSHPYLISFLSIRPQLIR